MGGDYTTASRRGTFLRADDSKAFSGELVYIQWDDSDSESGILRPNIAVVGANVGFAG